MKGITKDWKIVFLYSKINVKKRKIALHLRIYISFSQYWSWVSCIYDILAIFRLSCKISHMKDTYQKISRIYLHFYHHVTTYFLYAHVVYFHSKYLKKGSFVKSIYRRSKTYLKWFFLFIHLIARVASFVVLEWVKLKKSLAIHYWQDMPSLVSSSIIML